MSQQNWNASDYIHHAAFVPAMAGDVVSLLNPNAGETILDIGCGDGELTYQLQKQGCSVIGIDSSPSMIAKAKQRGLETYVMDGHYLPYRNQFEAVTDKLRPELYSDKDDWVADYVRLRFAAFKCFY
jgi:trans-aconitate methyltransferase